MTEQQKFELIERYLKGQLNTEELEAFEVLRLTDASFDEEIELQKMSHQAIQDLELLDLKKTMSQDFADMNEAKGSKAKWGLWTIAIAGLVGGAFLIHNAPQQNEEQAQAKPSVRTLVIEETNSSEQTAHQSSDETIVPPNAKNIKETNPQHRTSIPTETSAKVVSNTEENKTKLEATTKPSERTSQPKEVATESPAQKSDEPVVTQPKDINPCDTTVIRVEAKVSDRFKDESNGKISIDMSSVRGGQAPYLFGLDSQELQNDYTFYDLDAGEYSIWVKDANHCLVKAGQYEIKESSCFSNYKKTLADNYDADWTVPTDMDKAGTFQLYSRQGSVIQSFRFEQGETLTWDGMAQNGQKASVGYYRFRIEYKDGQVCPGELTIFE